MSRTVFAVMLAMGLTACAPAEARETAGGDKGRRTPGRGMLDRTLVAGTLIEATGQDPMAWSRSKPGDTLFATVNSDVGNANHWIVIPAGSVVGVRVARRADPTPLLEVLSVTVAGQAYPVGTTAEVMSVVVPPQGRTRLLFVLVEKFTAWRSSARAPASK